MDKVVYRCIGTCQAIISEERFNEGLKVCGTESCNMYKKPFEKVFECKLCGEHFKEPGTHKH